MICGINGGGPESLEEFLEYSCEKLRDLETATILIKAKDAIKPNLFELRAAISDVQTDVEKSRGTLSKLREQTEQCRALIDLLQSLDRKILHMEENIPKALLSKCNENQNQSESSPEPEPKVERTIATKPVHEPKKPVKSESYPVIALIKSHEFAKVPKYIVGKQSLDAVNNFVESLNRLLKTKYSLLSMGKNLARRQGDMDMFIHYEKQELDMRSRGECVQFFTSADYERETNSKLSKAKLNQLIVLRHCKRIREYRVRNELRYIVVPNES